MNPVFAPIPLTPGEVRRWVGSDFISYRPARPDETDADDQYLMTAHDIISAFVNMGEVWPIAKLVIDSAGNVCGDSQLFTPGLPEGEHEVYPVPMMTDAAAVERNRICELLATLCPKEPNDVWESAYKHVIDDCLAAINGEERP